jgi:hypothetical protein
MYEINKTYINTNKIWSNKLISYRNACIVLRTCNTYSYTTTLARHYYTIFQQINRNINVNIINININLENLINS